MANEAGNAGLPTPQDSYGENAGPGRIWIRYRTELCHRYTGEILYSVDSDDSKPVELQRSGNEPIFEVITRYTARNIDTQPGDNGAQMSISSPAVGSSPSYLLRIYSPAIINALHSVVDYYPGQDLSGPVIVIKWPYPILAHHYEELRDFKDFCASKPPNELCLREKDASDHLHLLLQFLDDHIMERVRAAEERKRKGFLRFEDTWVIYKPGRTCIEQTKTDKWTARVISSVTGGIFQTPPVAWTIHGWNMIWDGEYLSRTEEDIEVDLFNGDSEESTGHIFDHGDGMEGELVEKLILDGERYHKLIEKQCKYHSGKSADFPYNEIDGLVMVDLKSFYAKYPQMRPNFMGDKDCRRWSSDCTCVICEELVKDGGQSVTSIFGDYNFVTREHITRHMYLLCPNHVPAFVFKLRTWNSLNVANMVEPVFQNDMIDTLVMEPNRVMALKALASSYIRINKHGNPIEHGSWAADFVKEKGSGLILLLHGKPGVGKTATAESIAQFTRRPLMSLTTSDIGTDPKLVEKNLTRDFTTARSWGAVLLIDEADVFMERRSSHDLERNSLVAGFLRALEFYDGILFLTTNRVGAFDDAFISRIHIQLLYKDFTPEERKKVWMTFVHKLTRERGNYIRVSLTAKEYIEGREVQGINWNGREIRNAFQTAVSLAEYEDERDAEGKILLTDEHLKSVVGLSKDFKSYLDELHKADESKRARKRFDRLDA
ncbi:hypothetical protein VPNG_01370 [Cytospora leucostoma]|uniref:AAA+ ATPase domain-containing protein n=1 Tax=Cytospora leucostoma TaxID=1230097 RepID=A0A423XM36_9PEZI|nr:hypothetical protein VPNG_01370 [Cytospora leucostoma]